MRFRFIDIALFALTFIFVNAFPVDLLPLDIVGQLAVRIGLRVILLAYYIYTLWRRRINIFRFANYRRVLLFVPFLLVCFSNIIAAGIAGLPFTAVTVDPLYLSLIIVYHLVGVTIEEFLFRLFIQNSLIYASSLKRILASGAIFALFHLINIINVSSIDALIAVAVQVVYAFGIGLLLAMIYEYTYSIPACICFHFIFNLLNMVLVENVFVFNIPMLTYYLTAVGCGLVVGIYAVVIYLLILQKNERYFRE